MFVTDLQIYYNMSVTSSNTDAVSQPTLTVPATGHVLSEPSGSIIIPVPSQPSGIYFSASLSL